jgi:hypothetical protein
MVFVSLILASLLSSAPATQDMPAPVELPDEARDALEEKWRDWAPAELPSAAACLKDGAAPASGVVRADFDSDGHPDYVLAVRTGGLVRLAVVLQRIPKSVVFDLDELAADVPAALTLAPRGSRFTPAGGIDDYYPAETIVVRRCDGSEVAYVWTGFSFRKTPIAGGTAPAPPAR